MPSPFNPCGPARCYAAPPVWSLTTEPRNAPWVHQVLYRQGSALFRGGVDLRTVQAHQLLEHLTPRSVTLGTGVPACGTPTRAVLSTSARSARGQGQGGCTSQLSAAHTQTINSQHAGHRDPRGSRLAEAAWPLQHVGSRNHT